MNETVTRQFSTAVGWILFALRLRRTILVIAPVIEAGVKMMMGERQVDQDALFAEFYFEKHVPVDHMLRSIDRFVELGAVRSHLAPFYSTTGRPSIDPELLIRMLIIGYCYGIRSRRRLCEEVHLNLAYRWFCRLGLAGEVPDHSTLSKNRHGLPRAISCAMSSRRWYAAAWPKGWWAAPASRSTASLIKADASRQKGVEAGLGAGGVEPRCRVSGGAG